MSLKVTQTSIPIDFNHQTDPNLIKTINLAPYSLNNLGHFKVQSSRQYLHYPYIYHEIRFCFATFQILALFYDQFQSDSYMSFRNVNTRYKLEQAWNIWISLFNLPRFSSNSACIPSEHEKQGHLLSNTIKNNFWSSNWKSWGGQGHLQYEKFTIKNC